MAPLELANIVKVIVGRPNAGQPSGGNPQGYNHVELRLGPTPMGAIVQGNRQEGPLKGKAKGSDTNRGRGCPIGTMEAHHI